MRSSINLKPNLILSSKVYPLQLPLSLPEDEKWKPYSIFKGITGGLREISCHVSALSKNNSPHAPHAHEEEELLILLSGSVNLKLPDVRSFLKKDNMDLENGHFVYYPSYFFHTLQTKSEAPANYLMFKWKTGLKNKNPELTFGSFDMFEDKDNLKVSYGFLSKTLFEASTLYLNKLHCHYSVLKPGSGYKPHIDIYDVAIIVLEGEIETLGKCARPHDVIFYAAGEQHGMYNPGRNEAKYIVFEFHAKKIILISKISNLFNFIFNRLTDLNFWKRRLNNYKHAIIKFSKKNKR